MIYLNPGFELSRVPGEGLLSLVALGCVPGRLPGLPFESFVGTAVPGARLAGGGLGAVAPTQLGFPSTPQGCSWFLGAGGSLGHPANLGGRSSSAENLTKL